MKPILLFDIDGTLMRIDRKFMKKLITDLMSSLGLDMAALESTSFAGRTDQSIFRSLLGTQKDDDRLYEKLKNSYIKQLRNRLATDHITVFEHARQCLHFFTDRKYHMGLLTGNFREIAAHKLGLLNLEHFFSFGAFGCNHTDRNMLGGTAQKSYSMKHKKDSKPEQFIIIGDTPLDIRCAKYFGCKSIAVTTGHYSREELAGYNPDLILESLENPERWIYDL